MTLEERWIKRHVHGAPQSAVIRCARGLAEVCADEVHAVIGDALHKAKFVAEVTAGDGGVAVENADFRQLLELTLRLTTAKDIVWTFYEAKADGVPALKKKLAEAPWNAVLAKDAAVAVKAVSQGSRVYHEGLIKEAVGEACGAALAPDRDAARQLLDVRLKDDRLTIGVSLSGFPLGHRGYRGALKAEAPLPEEIAAGATRYALAHAGRSDFSAVYAPFAGSGTTGYEAWIQLAAQPPSLWLPDLACERMPASPADTMRHLRAKLAERSAATRTEHEVVFIEKDKTVAAFLRAQRVAPGPRTKVLEADVLDVLQEPLASPTFLAMNPPYGIRLGTKKEAMNLYDALADRLARQPHAYGYVLAPATAVAPRFRGRLGALRIAHQNVVHGGLTITIVAFAPGQAP